MLYYYNGFRSTADWPYENKGYELRVLNWKQDVYISFIESFIKFYLCFINAINIFNQNCLSLQQKWPYINKKNICHQQWQQSDVHLACFTAITTLSFLNNWKWEMLFEEQNIMKEYSEYTEYLKALYQCAKIAQSLQCNIRPLFGLGLLCFYSKAWMYLTC